MAFASLRSQVHAPLRFTQKAALRTKNPVVPRGELWLEPPPRPAQLARSRPEATEPTGKSANVNHKSPNQVSRTGHHPFLRNRCLPAGVLDLMPMEV